MKILLVIQILAIIFSVTIPDAIRKKERQITDKQKIAEFLDEQKIIRIGYHDKANDEVYIVPINYGYKIENEDYIFYMHGGQKGRRYELAKEEPNVGFEIDGDYELVPGELACQHTAKYKSIIGNGKIQLVNDIEEKKAAMDIIMKHTTGKSGFEYNPKMLEKLGIYKLTATKLTCKANL